MKHKIELELDHEELIELGKEILLSALILEKNEDKDSKRRAEICYRIFDKINIWWEKEIKEEAK